MDTPFAAMFLGGPNTNGEMGTFKIGRPDLDGQLVAAASVGDAERVKSLLEERANVDARSDPRTALRGPATGLAAKIQRDARANVNATPSNKHGRTALQAAAGGGHQSVVQILLNGKVDINAVASDRGGRTALQAAAEGGHESVVKMLLAAGAEVNAPPAGYDGRTALQAAAEGGHESVVKLLLEKEADVNAEPSGYYGRTALRAAAEGGHELVVKLLIDSGADLNALPLGARGRTALQAAAEGGHESVVKMLLAAGANVNAAPAGYYGRTALQAAAEGGHELVVGMLLHRGADVNAAPSGSHGRTALQVSADGGYGSVVELLLDRGADVNANGSKGTALQAAAGGGHVSVVKMLLDRGAAIGEGVHSACIGGHQAIAQLLHERGERNLLEQKVKASVRDALGRSPLHLACLHSHLDVAKWYISSVSDADINLKDHEKQTPLHLSIRKGNLEVFNYLLEQRPNMEIADNEDRKPLHIALEATVGPAATKLLEKGASARGFTVEDWRTILPKDNTFLMTEEANGSKKIETVLGDELVGLNSARARHLVSVSTRYLYSTPNGGIDFGPFNFVSSASPSLTGVKWGWTKIGLGQLWDSQIWKNVIPNTSNIVTLAPREALISCSVVFSLAINGPGVVQQVVVGVSDTDAKNVEPFRMKGEVSQISWTMIARSDVNKGLDAKGSIDQKPLVNLRTVEYRGTLNIGWVPDHGVEFFTLFIIDLHSKWRRNLEDARRHQATNYGELLDGRGKNRLLIGTLLTDAQQWGQLRVLLGDQVASARGLVMDYGEKSLLYDELKCWEQDYGREGDAKRSLENLSKVIGELESGCAKEISGLEKKTKEMIELEFSLVSIYEAQRSTSMAASMKRLSWITFIFLPLMFVASLFGMNLDVLENNPSWVWYPIVGGPILALVLIVWLVFKNPSVEKWFEELFVGFLVGMLAFFRNTRQKMANLKKKDDEESGTRPKERKVD